MTNMKLANPQRSHTHLLGDAPEVRLCVQLESGERFLLLASAHALRLLARYSRDSVAVAIGCWLRVAGWWLADWLMGGLTGFRVMYNVMAGSVWV